MVKTKEEIMKSIKEKIGEDQSDETLSLLEDITDTFDDYDKKVSGDGTDWKKKYEDNDAEWRKKYRDRFFDVPSGNQNKNPQNPTSQDDEEDDEEDDEDKKPKTFDDLFVEGEK